MNNSAYRKLAERLDALPNGFPPTEEGVELRLLAEFFSPEEAELAASLKFPLERPSEIAARMGKEVKETTEMLKDMSRRQLIRSGRVAGGYGFGLMPFVVGIYEGLLGQISVPQARLFEQYYLQAFGQLLNVQPSVHRVIPIGESIPMDMEIHPYESATGIVDEAEAWGVIDCICRKQKAQIGEACGHPVDVCLILNQQPHVFDHHPVIKALTREEALATLHRSAEAGLVHSVSNSQEGVHYICNCCTCSCGILRGIKEMGIANAVARSAFVNHVDEENCIGCEDCLPYCQFDALYFDDDIQVMQVNSLRCVGCGVCVPSCNEEALGLFRRPLGEVKEPPPTILDWGLERAMARGLDPRAIL